jgi:hypothetical protein
MQAMGSRNKESGSGLRRTKKNGEEGDLSLYGSPTTMQTGLGEIDSIFSEKKKRPKRGNDVSSSKKKMKLEVAPRKFQSSRSIVEGKTSKGSSQEWVDDGLGGKFNAEGFTGRKEEGMKIFKAHVLDKPNSGYSKDCPFDCSCCFI